MNDVLSTLFVTFIDEVLKVTEGHVRGISLGLNEPMRISLLLRHGEQIPEKVHCLNVMFARVGSNTDKKVLK